MRKLVQHCEFWTKDTSARAPTWTNPAFRRKSTPGIIMEGVQKVQRFRGVTLNRNSDLILLIVLRIPILILV